MDKIKFAKLRPDAVIPSKRKGDAGYDLYANFDEDRMLIRPGEHAMIPTGICSSFPDRYVCIMKERGSTGSKCMALRCGVVDSNYRGEWFICINNTGSNRIIITKNGAGDDDHTIYYDYNKAIAQAVFLDLGDLEVEEVSLEDIMDDETDRGAGKLGSSNK